MLGYIRFHFQIHQSPIERALERLCYAPWLAYNTISSPFQKIKTFLFALPSNVKASKRLPACLSRYPRDETPLTTGKCKEIYYVNIKKEKRYNIRLLRSGNSLQTRGIYLQMVFSCSCWKCRLNVVPALVRS